MENELDFEPILDQITPYPEHEGGEVSQYRKYKTKREYMKDLEAQKKETEETDYGSDYVEKK